MTLVPGTSLGPYEIVAAVGAGGMGEVYRARDTRLDRTVAIKILPREFAANPASRLRFEREAKVISSLNHPHICALYDVGSYDSSQYLVMEFIDGESLADRLTKGSLPIDQALRIGIDIASALDRAHRQGIVHRDLKPGNIMLTRSGAKLLDFGLAHTETPGSADGSTVARPLTDQGAILGTFQYMAPEQVEGLPADARTDIFALGAVLYEAATGARAFEGKSKASLIASILDHEPAPISVVRPLAPPSLDRVVRACLRKDPAERIQTAHDLMLDLTWLRESASSGEGIAGTIPRRRGRWLAAIPIALLAATSILFATLYLRSRTRPRDAATFSLLPPAGATTGDSVAISPDGKSVAYVAALPGAEAVLWLRKLSDPVPHAIAGTEDTKWPTWSPDSEWIAFFSRGKLKKLNVATGSIKEICDAGYGIGAAWSTDGTILFTRYFTDSLFRVPAAGGEPVRVTTLNATRHETAHAWPHFLSDGRHFVHVVHTTAEQRNEIHAASLDGGPSKLVMQADSLVGFSAPYLLFVKESTLYAQRFDERSLVLRGEPVEVASNVNFAEEWGSAGASVSIGAIAYYPVFLPRVDMRVYDRSGTVVQTLLSDFGLRDPELSPDGHRLLMMKKDPKKGAYDLWIVDFARGLRTRITSGLSNHQDATWSPDGNQVLFSSDRGGMYDVYTVSPDEKTAVTPLWKSNRDKTRGRWSPGGDCIITAVGDPQTLGDLWMLPLRGGAARQIFSTEGDEDFPAISPDGQWLTFQSTDLSAAREIYVRRLAGGRVVQVSTKGGVFPAWSHDGSELFYMAPDRTLMSVQLRRTATALDPAVPKPLFAIPPTPYGRTFSVTRDGRFLVPAKNASDTYPDHVNVLIGWRSKLD
ncbi:MAG: protein kinase [Acidobacteriota bacterium]|nr:protein kinase [Acidobacteriota bacterium]